MDHFKKVAPGVNDTSDWRVQETKSTLFHQVAAEFLFPVDMGQAYRSAALSITATKSLNSLIRLKVKSCVKCYLCAAAAVVIVLI